MRLTWLADVLRAANLKVVEVDGWKDRGSDTFSPVGVTWHATAGFRSAKPMDEVGVILHGSETAPPPIAQLMLARDGTFYVCAAGRCNHNKQGWDGPNKGLGNTDLLGIEMANNNAGEPWPEVQLDAARRGTAAIMRKLGADPMKRLAAHYEHQPYATRPKGEGSTKSDPFGVDMRAERPRVAALMNGDDDVSAKDVWQTDGLINNWSWRSDFKTNPKVTASWALWLAAQEAHGAAADAKAARLTAEATLLAVKGVDDEGILAGVKDLAAKLTKLPDEIADAITDQARPVEDTVAALRAVLGDRAAEIGRLLASS